MIKINSLNKYFNKGKRNELHVLNDINVEFENKGLVCILGESGSGKTTLLNTIGGLDVFTAGEMIIGDETIKKYNPKQIEAIRNDKFGYIFQNYYLLQDYTVLYNVKLALNMFDISEEEKEERVEYVLKSLGIAKYKKKLVSQLSGGQQQRVSIARALVKSPQIILADEPTGNLDEENTIRTMSILKNISKECLVILVSHEKRIARFFADRIIEIQDGKIIENYDNKSADTYTRSDDSNIYLKDMVEQTVESENVEIHLFQQPESVDGKVKLNLAWKDGKLYIQNLTDKDMIVEGDEAGCRMLDEHKPELKMDDVEEFEYSLQSLHAGKSARLSFKEIWKMACENISMMGKKQAFVIGIILITSVMLAVGLADFMNRNTYDKHSIITDDSHYAVVSFRTAQGVTKGDLQDAVTDYCDKYVGTGDYSDIFVNTYADMSVEYDEFAQLSNTKSSLSGYCFASVDKVDKSSLICGRMPETKDEVVVDRWVLDNFSESDSLIAPVFDDIEKYIGVTLVSGITDSQFTIVGISDNNQPDIYTSENKLIGLTYSGFKLASLSELKSQYSDEYKDTELAADEVLLPESQKKINEYQDNTEKTLDDGNKYKIAGYFPDDLGVDYVLSDESCQSELITYMIQCKSFRVYTDDIKGATDYFMSKAADYTDEFNIEVSYPYEDAVSTYKEESQNKLGARNIITIAIAVLAFIMIYFTIKSNAISRIEELTVYRLIGIAKGSILKAYALEIFIISLYTVLPGVLITSGVIKFIATIPSLEFTLLFPWWSMGALIAGMFIINIIISIVPVYGILSKPPAALAVKE